MQKMQFVYNPFLFHADIVLQQACTRHLTCFALLHAWQWAHTQVKHRTLRMQVYVQWAPALGTYTHSSCICAREASWGEQRTSSRKVHTIMLRAELPGSWHRHRRQCNLALMESPHTEAVALAVTVNYGTSLSMDCQYGLCSRSLTSS